jgi:hypothetical protein
VPESFSHAHRRQFSVVTLLAALLGSALLAIAIRQVGWSNVVSGVASVGWGFLTIIVLGAIRMAMRARAWTLCVDPATERNDATAGPRLAFGDAFNALLVADAMGNVTPLGLLASEPARILMVRSDLTTTTSVASVTIENGFYSVSVLVVLLTGTWLFSQRASLPPALEQAAEIVVLGALIAGAVVLWAARRRPKILSRFAPILARFSGGAEAPADKLRDVETRIYDAVHWPISRIAHVFAWEGLFHVFAVAEVWYVLRLLPGGAHTTLQDAFLMESAGRFVTVVFKFIPFRLGVDEAGSGLVAQVVGIPAATGVTLALIRRLRIIVLNAVGLVVLSRKRKL